MSESKIRPIAICVIRRGHELLVFEGYDSVDKGVYYRPLGGGVDFGEHSRATVIREIQEEIGAEIVAPRLLGVLENVFVFEGERRHEIIFVYEATLADRSLLDQESPRGFEANGAPMKICWKSLAAIEREGARLVPDGLAALIG